MVPIISLITPSKIRLRANIIIVVIVSVLAAP